MKKTLALGITTLLASTVANAVDYETTLMYPTDITPTSLSQTVVGFYHSIDVANKTYVKNGVNITLKPAQFESSAAISANDNLFTVQSDLGAMIMTNGFTPKTYLIVGVGQPKGDAVGTGYTPESDNQLDFQQHSIFSLGYNAMLNPEQYLNITLAHEAGHSFAGDHSQADIAPTAVGVYTNAYGVTDCGNGVGSLMTTFNSPSQVEFPLISGSANCKVGSANNVAVMNHVANYEKNDKPLINNQTLSMAVTENVNTQAFDFVVTRTKTTNSGTATIYIAGSQNTTALTPISVTFNAGEAASNVASVPFTSLHPMFSGTNNYASVYAVALTDEEIQPSLTDIMAVNTQWTGSKTNDTSTSGSGSSGGSTSPIALLLIGLATLFRRQK